MLTAAAAAVAAANLAVLLIPDVREVSSRPEAARRRADGTEEKGQKEEV